MKTLDDNQIKKNSLTRQSWTNEYQKNEEEKIENNIKTLFNNYLATLRSPDSGICSKKHEKSTKESSDPNLGIMRNIYSDDLSKSEDFTKINKMLFLKEIFKNNLVKSMEFENKAEVHEESNRETAQNRLFKKPLDMRRNSGTHRKSITESQFSNRKYSECQKKTNQNNRKKLEQGID